MNTISVGMTTYNSSKYVEEQLLSIVKQTILPDEIVIYDDCSTDNTVDILYAFKEKWSDYIDIKIHVNEKNIGVRRNFESCFLACFGDIIFSCDADDVWVPQKIEKVLKVFTDDSVVYVYHDYYVTDSNLNITKGYEEIPQPSAVIIDDFSFIRNAIRRKGIPLGMSIAFRKRILKEIVPFLQDHDGWIGVTSPLFGKIMHIQENLAYYRRHEGTTSTAYIGKSTLFLNVMGTTLGQRFHAPLELAEVYEQYLAKFDKHIPNTLKQELKEQIETSKELSCIPEFGRIKGVKTLFKTLQKGRYLQYRGNYKTFGLDLLCVLRNAK